MSTRWEVMKQKAAIRIGKYSKLVGNNNRRDFLGSMNVAMQQEVFVRNCKDEFSTAFIGRA